MSYNIGVAGLSWLARCGVLCSCKYITLTYANNTTRANYDKAATPVLYDNIRGVEFTERTPSAVPYIPTLSCSLINDKVLAL